MSLQNITNEDRLSLAHRDYEAGRFKSLRECAREWQVSHSTLSRRLRGQWKRQESNIRSQLLSPDLEEIIIAIIKDFQQQNWPCTYLQVRNIAFKIGHLKKLPSDGWMERFMKRHPELSSSRGKMVSNSRVTALSLTIVNDFFDNLDTISAQYNIPPSRWWNMDEIGYRHGHSRSETVLFSDLIGPPLRSKSDDTLWSTALECANTEGDFLPPMIIYTGKELNDYHFPQKTPLLFDGWTWALQKNGWTDQELALDWLHRVFTPRVKPTVESPVILILDGHGSHRTGEFAVYCYWNHIHYVFLPPHSSHNLQPMDLGPFNKLKPYYAAELKKWDPLGQTKVTRLTFNELYQTTRVRALTRQNIRAGWSRSGIWPRNRDKILQHQQVTHAARITPPPEVGVTNDERALMARNIASEFRSSDFSPRSRRRISLLSGQYLLLFGKVEALEYEFTEFRRGFKVDQERQRRFDIAEAEGQRVIAMNEILERRGMNEIDALIDAIRQRRKKGRKRK